MTNLKIRIAIILICMLLSSPQAAFAQAEDIGVFNPSKVDWWVSMDDSIISNQQNCEVHWLFDDSLDISLSVSDAYRLFFTFRVRPKGKEVTPPLQLRKGMADKASLMVEDVSHPLGITEIDVHPAMVVMGIPDLLNNLSYVKDANRLLLNLDNTVYNFPLENMDENIEYFEKCLESVDPGALAKIQNSPAEPYAPAAPEGSEVPYDYAVEIEPLEPEISFANPPIEEAAPETIDAVEAEEAEMAQEGEPDQGAMPNGKQTDDMLADMKYEGVSDKTAEELEEAEPEEEKIGQIVKNKRENTDSCSGSAFDERGTAIINNLTTKLAILEKEKEDDKKILETSLKSLSQLKFRSGNLILGNVEIFKLLLNKLDIPKRWRLRLQRHYWRENYFNDLLKRLETNSDVDPTIVEIFGLKKPFPMTNSPRPVYMAHGVSIAIDPCPKVMSSAPSTTAHRYPMTLSAKYPPIMVDK